MKRSARLITMVVVLAVFASAYIITTKYVNNNDSSEQQIKVADITMDNLKKISVSGYGDGISLVKSGDNWKYENDDKYPVNQVLAVSLAQKLTSLTATSVIEHPSSLADYGLDSPDKKITAVLSDGKNIVLETGDINAVTQELYLKSSNGNVYLVSASFGTSFEVTKDSFLQKEIIPYVTPAEVTVTSNGKTLTVKKDDNDVWRCGDEILDTGKTLEFTSSLASVSWLECMSYDADEAELAAAGFASPTATIYVKGDDERDFKILFGNKAENKIFAKFENSSMFYTVDSAICEFFITDTETLK